MERLLSETDLDQAGANVADPWLVLAANAVQMSFFNWDVVADQLRWNQGAEERLGVAPGAIASAAAWMGLVDPASQRRLAASIRTLRRTRAPAWSQRCRLAAPGGSPLVIEASARCLYDEGGELRRLMGVSIDVTACEQAKQERARFAAQLQSIVETVPDPIIIIAAGGIIRTLNGVAADLFGWQKAELVGKTIAMLIPQDPAGSESAATAALLSGAPERLLGKRHLLSARRSDGEIIPIEVNVGETALGSTQLFTVFIHDIREHIAAARKLDDLRAQFLQGARLTAMGAVAAGLAHELNQPLASAANYLAAASINAVDPAKAAVVIEQVHAAAAEVERTGEIIRRLRGFLSQGARTPQHLLMRDVIAEAIGLALAGPDRDHVAVAVTMRPPQLSVRADRVQVQQVLVNLIRNAVEAMADMPPAARRLDIKGEITGSLCEFQIEDTGPGFPDHVLAQRHQPFTSSDKSAGMGLGLSICRRIIEAQGGTLWACNQPQGGACVAFTLVHDPDGDGGAAG